MAKVPGAVEEQNKLVESCLSGKRNAVVVARAVVGPENEQIPVLILNPRTKPVNLKREQIARMEPVIEEVAVAATTTQQPASPQPSTEEQEQLLAALLGFPDIFSRGPDDLGRTAKIKHKVYTGNTAPICQQVRRILPIRQQETSKLLKEMLEKEVIQPSTSPWASPIVLVRNKDGSTRFCVAFRKVNTITRKMHTHFPESMTSWILSLELSGSARLI